MVTTLDPFLFNRFFLRDYSVVGPAEAASLPRDITLVSASPRGLVYASISTLCEYFILWNSVFALMAGPISWKRSMLPCLTTYEHFLGVRGRPVVVKCQNYAANRALFAHLAPLRYARCQRELRLLLGAIIYYLVQKSMSANIWPAGK